MFKLFLPARSLWYVYIYIIYRYSVSGEKRRYTTYFSLYRRCSAYPHNLLFSLPEVFCILTQSTFLSTGSVPHTHTIYFSLYWRCSAYSHNLLFSLLEVFRCFWIRYFQKPLADPTHTTLFRCLYNVHNVGINNVSGWVPWLWLLVL